MTDGLAGDQEVGAKVSTQAYCFVCGGFRGYANVPVSERSARFRAGYDTDDLTCSGCGETIVTVAAPIEAEGTI